MMKSKVGILISLLISSQLVFAGSGKNTDPRPDPTELPTEIAPQPTSTPSPRTEREKQLSELLKACDTTVMLCTQTVDTKNEVIAKQGELLDAQAQRITQLEGNEKSILKSPLLWFAAGMLVTGLTVHWVKK